jgi:hypothetical protein
VAAFGHERHDGRDERVAELARDRVGRGPQHEIVLAGGRVRPVLLDASRADDDGGLPGAKGVAHFHEGHLVDEERVGGRNGPRLVRILGPLREGGRCGRDEQHGKDTSHVNLPDD